MARRSDFAQKLLDDLRLRKERIAASQSSNRSNPVAGDSYTYSKQTHRGSRSIKPHEMIGSKTTAIQNKSTAMSRSSMIKESSHQIVPYGQGRRSEPVGDLSMALAFAIENGGILRRTDSSTNNSLNMLGFINHIGRTSTDGQISLTSGFPNLSHLHIKEISKGAQKLNQILRACSNGVNFDRYSIEIGKELMKGAMDLEESLRMLVNLQEASDYTVGSQRKNRIVLLEDEEDDADHVVGLSEQKQLGRPRFSFDKPSSHFHNIQEPQRNNHSRQSKALPYTTKGTNYNHENQALVIAKSVSHMRTGSYGLNINSVSTFSEQRNHSGSSQPKVEKVRIPNVVAKLMGLDDLPQQADTKFTRQKDSTQEQRLAQGRNNTVVKKTKETDHLEPSKRQKVAEPKRNHVIQNLPTSNQKPKQKHTEEIQLASSLEKAFTKNKKQQSNMVLLNQNNGSQKNNQDKERRHNDSRHREQKGIGMGSMKEQISWEQQQQMEVEAHQRLETAMMLKGKTSYGESMLQTEKRFTNKILLDDQQRYENGLRLKQPYNFQKPEQQEGKNEGEEREQQSAKQKLQASKQNGSEAMNSKKKQQQMSQATPSKKSSREVILNGRHNDDLVTHESSTNFNLPMKSLEKRNSDQNYSLDEPESESGKGKARVPMEKPFSTPATQKAKDRGTHKSEAPRKVDELATRRNGMLKNFGKPSKHQSSILQEAKSRRNEKLSGKKGADQVRSKRSKEIEPHIIKSNKTTSNIQQLNLEEPQKEDEQASLLHAPPKAEFQSLTEPILPPNDKNQSMVPTIIDEQQNQTLVSWGDEKLKFASNALSGNLEVDPDISNPSQPEHQKSLISRKQESLTESEHCLKQILITSELFLNTAEALFRLNIPFDVLNASGGQDRHDEESKLVLDCGYEVMKRKGRRQELILHPCAKLSVRSTTVNSLDNLIRELCKDFHTLKFYGRKGHPKSDVEDYLPVMLETDVHNGDPDVNCMWDLGWNEAMFGVLEKDDVVRDVEKHVLHGLVDEITRELLPVCA